MLTLSKSTSHGCGLPLCLSALFRCREIITYTTVLKLKRILCELCECEHLHMLCIALLLLSILMLSNPLSFSVPFSCYRSCCACKCECSNVCVCERECFNVCVRSCLVLESNAICPGILLSFLFHLLFDWIFFFSLFAWFENPCHITHHIGIRRSANTSKNIPNQNEISTQFTFSYGFECWKLMLP